MFGGAAIIEASSINENTAGNGGRSTDYNGNGGHGGGIYGSGYLVLGGCSITSNRAGTGGGYYGNCGGDGGDGGGVSCGSSALITNCTFGNNAPGAGGTGYYEDGDDGSGAGISCGSGSTVTNCVLWSDLPLTGGQIDGSPSVTYTCIQDCNSFCDDPNDHNISDDPLFVDPNGPDGDPNTWEDNDYHLSPTSPCINAGDPNFVVDPNFPNDIDGDARVVAGRVDMGADEVATLSVLITKHRDFGEISVDPVLANYGPNTLVTLTATVQEDRCWDGWSGDVDPADRFTNPLTITVDSPPMVIETGFNCGLGAGPMLPLMLGVLGLVAVVRRRR